jgi:DNA-directed RNA polymerase subunit M/transcription elongation factor TFIIS
VQICREDGEILIPNQTTHTVETLFAEEMSRDDLIERQNILKLRDDEKNDDGSVSQSYHENNANQSITWAKLQITCKECNIPFLPYQLSDHQIRVHHNPKSRNFTCTSCPDQKNFFNLESFINHTFTIHHLHLRNCCYICDGTFWNFKGLYKHYKNEHKEHRVNMCLYCAKFFKSE